MTLMKPSVEGVAYIMESKSYLKAANIERWKAKFGGSTAPKPSKIYTGINMLGIAQIPKSNAIPVFSINEAKGTVKVK